MMKKEHENFRKIVIRKSRFRISDLFYIGTFLFFVYLVVVEAIISFFLILLCFLMAFFVLRIIQRQRDVTEQIVVDENGITLHQYSRLIEWDSIKYAYLKQKVIGLGHSTRVVESFHVETKNKEYTVSMDDLSYNPRLLAQSINYYSGREIGHISNKLNDKAFSLVKNKELAEKMYVIFSSFYKKQMNVSLLVLFVFLSVSIFLQIIVDFPYVFAIGWTLNLLVLIVWSWYAEKVFRNHELLKHLDDKTYEKLSNEYGRIFNHKSSKGQNVAGAIFLFITVLIVFVVSYMIQ